MNILILYDGRYGVETYISTLCKELKILGHNCLNFRTPILPSDAVFLKSLLFFLKDVILRSFMVIRLVKVARGRRIDVIHVHSAAMPLILGYLIHVVCGVPLIMTVHNAYAVAIRLNRLYKKANNIIVISKEVSEKMISYNVNKDKLIVIPNMIDTSLFFPKAKIHIDHGNQAIRKLVYIGRIDSHKIKIIITIMESMKCAVKEFPNIQMLIVGGGSKFQEAYDMAEEINRQHNKALIVMLGYQQKVDNILNSAEIVIGVGRVVLEAMASGKPVIIATVQKGGLITGGLLTEENVDKFKEYNFTGRNFKAYLNPLQISKLMINLLSNEQIRRNIGLFNRKFIKENYDVKIITKQIENIYKDSMAKNIKPQ